MKDKTFIRDIIIAIVSLVFVVGVGFGIWKLSTGEKITTKEKVSNVSSGGGSKTPQEAVAKYIYTAGNMYYDKDLTIENINNGSARGKMIADHKEAYSKLNDMIITDGPIKKISADDANELTKNAMTLEMYRVPEDSIRVSKDIETFSDTTNSGKDVSGVVVNGSFESFAYRFKQKVTDSSSDGTYLREVSKKEFKDIPFYVVKVDGGNWKVFDMKDNDEIGTRFAIWDPNGITDNRIYESDGEIKGNFKVNEIAN